MSSTALEHQSSAQYVFVVERMNGCAYNEFFSYSVQHSFLLFSGNTSDGEWEEGSLHYVWVDTVPWTHLSWEVRYTPLAFRASLWCDAIIFLLHPRSPLAYFHPQDGLCTFPPLCVYCFSSLAYFFPLSLPMEILQAQHKGYLCQETFPLLPYLIFFKVLVKT